MKCSKNQLGIFRSEKHSIMEAIWRTLNRNEVWANVDRNFIFGVKWTLAKFHLKYKPCETIISSI